MIICLIGAKGDGKTLMMTKYLYIDKILRGRTIYSNYGLSFNDNLLDMELLENYTNENQELNKASLGIDECHIFFDSRSFMSNKNKNASYFFLQTRKRKVNCYLTFQRINQVDKRIRQNASYIIQCASYEMINNRLHKLIEGEPILSEENVYIIETIFRNGSNGFEYVNKKITRAKDIYKLYNTEEIINFV